MTIDRKRDEESRLADLQSLGILDSPGEERFDRLIRLTRRTFNVPFAALSLIDEDREWFKSRQGFEVSELPREGSFSAEVIWQPDVSVVHDASLDPRFEQVARDTGIKFYAGYPIHSHRGYPIGSLTIADTTPRAFSEEDRLCLMDLADLIEEEVTIQTLANVDDLTNLFNRRGFLGIGEHAIAICKRMRRPATMMFFDLDGFKSVNDTYGHAEGDKVLKNIGGLLESVFRNSDVVARMGGDEFCVLLTGTDTAHVDRPLANLSESIELQNNHTPYSIGYSVGVVEYDNRHETLSRLVEEADLLMYEQKKKRKLPSAHAG
ncbi:MAG: sensor domain-containing diguanylate cyclase [Gammaproteobacteria bacterium]|jgi:diguanylate cyclase (GGDEF)-like protein|nr:sensor domain-containing diguanylate cyclase [Gammaproteobacteria bacterium]MBT4494844.1 sensor domain-containing diguanylate cyclase [Gammaproteobacteria bacterium]MBT7369357.1 sensor domain-containing diguanylate cyclase [Gammaproteobacteria bacterium]